MPGPPPKPRALRQRRNKVAGAAMLPAEGSLLPPPVLPDRGCADCSATGKFKDERCPSCSGTCIAPWHPFVLAWWQDVWASPMAVEFLKADTHGLFVLAELRDQFWRTGDRELAAEIRLQEQRFGLSSLDRRRLQWEVERVEQARKGRRTDSPDKKKRPVVDPRRFLKAVK